MVKMHGELITFNEQNKLKQIYESISNIKFLNFVKNKSYFKAKHSHFSDKLIKILIKNSLINITPKYFTEIILFLGVIASLIFLSISGLSFSLIVAKLSLFAVAAIKILPAINQIYQSIISIKSNDHALIEFQKEFEFLSKNNYTQKNFDKSSAAPLYFNKKIEAKNINFNYNNSKFGINNVSLEIRKNEFIGFCGKTGSGKTTLVDIISGLYEPSSGNLFVDGIKVDAKNINLFKSKIGYVPQDIYLSDDTLEKNIAFGVEAEDIDKALIKKAAQIAAIDQFIENELEKGYQTFVGERGVRLSGGQRQRIGIARALYHQPEIIVFDEATSALDNETEKEVLKAIKNASKDRTVIMIAHRLNTLKDCDVIYKLDKGQIVFSGSYQDVIKSA
jgi:ATP-binding cassette subfamily C protein